MEVAGAAQVGVLQNGGGLGIAGRHRFSASGFEIAQQAQNPEASPEALLRMRAARQNSRDQTFRLRADGRRPTAEALRGPVGIAPMGTRHVVRVGAVPAPTVAALMGCHALAAVEDLDRAAGGPQVDLRADQAVRNRIEEAVVLDVIVRADPHEAPFGELVVVARQRRERRALHRLEEMPAADPEAAHDMIVDALARAGNRRIGFGQREESLVPQPSENAGLGKAHAILHFGFVLGLSWPRRQDADAVMRGHHAVAAVDLGIVERGPVDP